MPQGVKLYMRQELFERILFAFIAFIFAILLAFRPIPSIDNANDTGRYVVELKNHCVDNAVSSGLLNQDISYGIFYAVTSPACWLDSDRIFLFLVACFVPLTFLLLAKWCRGTSVWACSLLFSVYGLELATNAMRQSFAMLLFFWALSLVFLGGRLKLGFLIGLLSAAAHTSTLVFLPLLFWVSEVKFPKSVKRVAIVFLVSLLCFAVIFKDAITVLSAAHDFYSDIYAEELNPSFILYMTLPLYFIYGLRRLFEKCSITMCENKALIYSTLLLLVVFIFYPTISYRYAIFAVSMQMFLVCISDRHSLRVGGGVLITMLLHLLIMVFLSKNYAVLIYG